MSIFRGCLPVNAVGNERGATIYRVALAIYYSENYNTARLLPMAVLKGHGVKYEGN